MTPSARVQAAIELVDKVIAAAREGGPAADTLIARYFAERRYAGSKDRRAVRDLVYAAIRALGDVPTSGRAAMLTLANGDPALAALFDGSRHGPPAIGEEEPAAERSIAPKWLTPHLRQSDLDDAELAALIERAPLDIRVNALKAQVADVVAALPEAQPISGLPNGLRLPPDTQVDRTTLWADGAIEVQDAGSQWVTKAAAGAPGMTVIDLCAGAGGKTLGLAADMANKGRIIACDTDRARLSRLMPRAERAGVNIAETQLLNPGRERDALGDLAAMADIVLIDAPCSGTGTWRRNPETRWRLTPDRLARLADTQRRLLDIGAALVKPGGALVYVVCSVLDVEGAEQVGDWLAVNSAWTAAPPMLGVGNPRGPGLRLTPLRESTDGFFVARLVAP